MRKGYLEMTRLLAWDIDFSRRVAWARMRDMPKFCLCGFVLGLMLCPIAGWAQVPGFPQIQGERVDADAALDRALKKSSLTVDGKPFHAVMEIGTAGTEYSGQVEVWWINAAKYRLKVTSPKFSQEKIVNGAQVQEKNEEIIIRGGWRISCWRFWIRCRWRRIFAGTAVR